MKEIKTQLKNHFTLKYKAFIELGQSILKTKDIDIKEDFLIFEELAHIEPYVTDNIIEKLSRNYNNDPENLLEIPFNITELICNQILNKYAEYINNKQYFEIIPWAYTYSIFNIKYYALAMTVNTLYNTLINPNTCVNTPFYTLKTQDKQIELSTLMKKFLDRSSIKQFLGSIKDYKLDFTGSGQILIAILINDSKLLDFAGVHKINNNTLGGYDEVLEVFKENYNNNKNYAFINDFLLTIEDEDIRQKIKNIIFSRNIVKNDLMVKGYSGTIYGSANKIKSSIEKFLMYNCVKYNEGDIIPVIALKKMCNKIAKELDTIIEKLCPSISQRYLKLINNIAKYIKDINNGKGILIPNNITTYYINPKERKQLQIKLNIIDENTKTLKRNSRREISFYIPETNHKKLKSSLGADIIQGFDGVVAYYIKHIAQLLNPQLKVATIFDAFIFSGHLTHETFKNISRLACQLAFKNNFINELINLNKIPTNEFYESFNNNIFTSLKNNKLEQIIESEFLCYLIKNQHKWLISTKRLNYAFLLKSLKLLNKQERTLYHNFIKNTIEKDSTLQLYKNQFNIFGKRPETLLQINNKTIYKDITNLEKHYKIKFILLEVENAINELYNNFFIKDDNNIINQLNQIINNDTFIK